MTTKAGERLLDDLAGDTEGTVVLAAYREGLAHDIAEIEAEAVRDALTDLRAAVEELPQHHCSPCPTAPGDHGNIERAAVLDEIDKRTPGGAG